MGGLYDNNSMYAALAGLAGGQRSTSSNPFGGNLAALASLLSGPPQPEATTYSQVQQAEERFDKRLKRLREILPIASGRVIPDEDDLIIGGARRLHLAVLFLDVCKFSRIESGDDASQDQVLTLLNLFMAEMLHVVKSHQGVFEKNTGDGLMAYFGDASQSESTERAVKAAVTMHCYNDQIMSTRLRNLGLPEIKFRVGIDTGLVTVANVGIRGDHHSLVAVGNTPNVACKLMALIPDGGIVLGNSARSLLPAAWQSETTSKGTLDGFFFRGTQTPYSAWELKYRAPKPLCWVPSGHGTLLGR